MKGLKKTQIGGRLLGNLVSKKTRFAAVDIGSGEIKVVEVSIADGGPTVTAFGRHPTPVNALGDPVDEEALVNALREVFPASGIQVKEVFATIGGDRVITRHINVPLMPGRELETAIRFEAEKFIPIPVDELTIRYLNLGEIESAGEKSLHLLLAAVPTSLVYDYYRIFTRSGLSLAAVDLQSLGLWRVFSGFNTSAALEGTVGILDIGASTTQLLVMRDRALQFTRSLSIGGNLLTRSLAEHYRFDFEEAERLKAEEGELFSTGKASVSEASGTKRMDFSLRNGLSKLVREIRRSFDYYAALENAAAIERLIISGGTSKLKGFREFFAGAMEAPVDFASPGVTGLPRDETIDTPFDPAFAVVLGTALREVAV